MRTHKRDQDDLSTSVQYGEMFTVKTTDIKVREKEKRRDGEEVEKDMNMTRKSPVMEGCLC